MEVDYYHVMPALPQARDFYPFNPLNPFTFVSGLSGLSLFDPGHSKGLSALFGLGYSQTRR
jgi:hypothetical protein